jgi:hypothetical protein
MELGVNVLSWFIIYLFMYLIKDTTAEKQSQATWNQLLRWL